MCCHSLFYMFVFHKLVVHAVDLRPRLHSLVDTLEQGEWSLGRAQAQGGVRTSDTVRTRGPVGLPPVAATATAVDLTGDLRPRAVSRWPVESLKKFLTGWHGQRDGRDGSTGCGTCEVPTVSFLGFNCGASPKLSRIDKRNSDIRVRRLPKSQQIDRNLEFLGLLTAEMNNPLNGRDGRVSTGRRGRKPCRSRAVDLWRKWLTEWARHPFDGCRRTVPTVTGGSPKDQHSWSNVQTRFGSSRRPLFVDAGQVFRQTMEGACAKIKKLGRTFVVFWSHAIRINR
ncbi:hypothetical protein C8J57DRAFT_1261744 [Mycena rebaudengoi]|nr:hypothetical protein C8J57DRAFT_1261744 [Mycena rebaudengoi]